MIVRQEQPADYDAVYEMVKAAFATSSNDGEWDYLNAVRRKDAFIPELSLVAEEAGRIVGQVVLYRTDLTTEAGVYTELLLSPISVHPDHFRRGIASAMMERAFAIARGMGFTAVFLCGEPAFYRRFGFRPTYEYGIIHAVDDDGTAEWCMALELVPGALSGKEGLIDIV